MALLFWTLTCLLAQDRLLRTFEIHLVRLREPVYDDLLMPDFYHDVGVPLRV